MPDRPTEITGVRTDIGEPKKEPHNDLVWRLLVVLDQLGAPSAKAAEVDAPINDNDLSLEHRGERWDIVFRAPDGRLWGIELKKLRTETDAPLPDL